MAEANSLNRPSGAVVYTDVVAKVFPTEGEAALAFCRQTDNPQVAVRPIAQQGRILLMDKCRPYELPHQYLNLEDLMPTLRSVWEKETLSFKRASVDEYIGYVLRDPKLPQAFRLRVRTLSKWFDYNPENAKQIHGDLTIDNVVTDGSGRFRLIDWSVRSELAYREADTAKFHFHMYRKYVHLMDRQLSKLTEGEKFFFASHFCRVWTRDVPARPRLEELFTAWTDQTIGA